MLNRFIENINFFEVKSGKTIQVCLYNNYVRYLFQSNLPAAYKLSVIFNIITSKYVKSACCTSRALSLYSIELRLPIQV